MSDSSIRTVLVTGAARGIGLATVKRFLADNWRVALLDIDAHGLGEAMAQLDAPTVTLSLVCDVADPAGVAAAVDATVERFDRLDALVNNAGTAVFKPLLETTHQEWQRVLDVNLTGPFLTTQAAAPAMADNGGGAIVNITSISGLRASTLRVA
ncbi:MAG: SDR family oxidoreductase, partial [Bosea sp.]|nr:SDR family oxidoreductase [Bosea sp. (in: a-proteobacteria)]